MIQFEQFELANGLRVIVHEDHSTPMAVVNVMYDVGARDEDAAKTGFAHLFEHLMFGGSVNIPSYDEPLQRAGGENNAYTTNDLTNYYCQLPAENIETAFWLESDRMLSLAFDEKSLEVQRKVVCEEFKEHYLNKPYGDVWHKMRNLAFIRHPYRWMTIGAELSHIENATLEDVKAFFYKHYRPVNAILTVAGHVKTAQVQELAEKWFGDIPSGERYIRRLPQEPVQTSPRKQEIHANVPVDAFYKSWHICSRSDSRYYATDLLTEVLSGGGSSRLFQSLVKEKQIFSNIGCYHFGSMDAGLVTIEGKLVKGVKMEDVEAAVESELQKIKDTTVDEKELRKVKNKTESLITFEDMSLMNRAGSLSFYTLMGNTNMINEELDRFQQVSAAALRHEAETVFDNNNSSVLYYFGNH
ncbi:MAG: insulinase family protein [Chitinophagaceae bacterium]|nr:insulinase family protein [Chitinophagaceae bacterium]